uniref:Uncharacterized protein n=1 Tax=Ciona savignyi TaxID=51511 RepID=H2YK00_CIOSA
MSHRKRSRSGTVVSDADTETPDMSSIPKGFQRLFNPHRFDCSSDESRFQYVTLQIVDSAELNASKADPPTTTTPESSISTTPPAPPPPPHPPLIPKEAFQGPVGPVQDPIPLPPPLDSDTSSFRAAAGLMSELLSLQVRKVSNRTQGNQADTQPKNTNPDEQLERFPAKAGAVPTQGTNVQPSTGINSSKTVEKRSSGNSNSDDEDDARFLLSKLDDLNLSSKEKEQQNSEDGQRSLFVQELLLSIFAEGADADPVVSSPLHMQRAVATDCPLLASTPNRTTTTEDSVSVPPDNQSPIETNKSTSNNNDTGVGHSMLSGSSPLAQSLSSGLHGSSLLDVQPTGSRSAPHLAPGGGDRVSSDPERWVYREEEDSKDSDEDKPPSPTPMLGLRMPGRMFAAGPLRVTAGVGGAAVNDFNRDEVPTSTLTKHIR